MKARATAILKLGKVAHIRNIRRREFRRDLVRIAGLYTPHTRIIIHNYVVWMYETHSLQGRIQDITMEGPR